MAARAVPFFGSRGALARALPGYEERRAQQELAEAARDVLTHGGTLLAEAGTGTGKTLAYLLPAVELGRRVVVSTGTKNLQEQLVNKDLPILARALGRDLNVARHEGPRELPLHSSASARSRRRAASAASTRSRSSARSRTGRPRTDTGDRAEIEDLPDNVDFWREMSAGSENCIGQSCSDFDTCWVTRMRQRALEADVVVVNHHLLCADLAVKESSYGSVIPEYDTLIVDEAHLLEDVATQYFGQQLSVAPLRRPLPRRRARAEGRAARRAARCSRRSSRCATGPTASSACWRRRRACGCGRAG